MSIGKLTSSLQKKCYLDTFYLVQTRKTEQKWLKRAKLNEPKIALICQKMGLNK